MVSIIVFGVLLSLAAAQQPMPTPPAVHCWANLSSALWYDDKTFTVWQLDSVPGSKHVHAKCLSDTSRKSDTVIEVGEWVGEEGWNVSARFPPDTTLFYGTLEQITEPEGAEKNNTCGRVYFEHDSGSPGEPIETHIVWSAGPKPPALLNCHFSKAPFHYNPEPGEQWTGWAQVAEFDSVSSMVFTLTSLNGSFEKTTATIREVSGYGAVGEVTIQNSTGATKYDFTLSGHGAPGQYSYCEEFTMYPKGTMHTETEDAQTWGAGPSPVPPMRPCTSLYDEKGCRNAWLNKCAWCTSSDKVHELCFDAKQAKLLPHAGWSCTPSEDVHVQVV